MTFAQFIETLPFIDWYYNMSDDHRAYLLGSAQVERYRTLAQEHGGEWQIAFDEQREAHP